MLSHNSLIVELQRQGLCLFQELAILRPGELLGRIDREEGFKTDLRMSHASNVFGEIRSLILGTRSLPLVVPDSELAGRAEDAIAFSKKISLTKFRYKSRG